MRKLGMIVSLAILVAGCEDKAPAAHDVLLSQPSDTLAGGPYTHRDPTPVATQVAAEGHEVEIKNDLIDFEYSYPSEAVSIPALKALMDQRLSALRTQVEAAGRQDKTDAEKAGFPYRMHASTTEWDVVANLPRWLSLSADIYSYTGGAHGMTNFDALLWDRKDNVSRVPLDLFTSKVALSSAVREPFCAALDKERAKRREEPVNRKSGNAFDVCIDPVEHTVILGSGNGRTFDRIGILVEPYAAGPYAEGTFDITVPVTAQVMSAVKPQFQSEFSVK